MCPLKRKEIVVAHDGIAFVHIDSDRNNALVQDAPLKDLIRIDNIISDLNSRKRQVES